MANGARLWENEGIDKGGFVMDGKNGAAEREKLLMEWMRSDAAFKSLARKYGKGGRPARVDPPEEEGPGAGDPAAAREAALLEWLEQDEAFKGLAKKFGRGLGSPGAD